MRLLTWMQPRDLQAGRRVVSALCAVGLVVTLIFLPLSPQTTEPTHIALVIAAAVALLLVAGLAVFAWFFEEASRVAWAVSPFIAIAAIVVVDLATHDAAVSAQIFFLFPTLYGAALLPRPGAMLVTAASDLWRCDRGRDPAPARREALVDGGYVAAALTATADHADPGRRATGGPDGRARAPCRDRPPHGSGDAVGLRRGDRDRPDR